MPPFATNPCDLRVLGKSRAEWNHTILLNLNVRTLLENDVLLLLELVDFSPSLLLDKPNELNRDNLYPIAWGYLRLSGLSKYHIKDNKIQLYENIFDTRKYDMTETGHKRQHNVPDIYFDFIWPNKKTYPGYITVSVDPVHCPAITQVPKDPSSVFEEEILQEYQGGNRSRSMLTIAHQEYIRVLH